MANITLYVAKVTFYVPMITFVCGKDVTKLTFLCCQYIFMWPDDIFCNHDNFLCGSDFCM